MWEGYVMSNAMPDVHGKKIYREDRDQKMYKQFKDKKMTVYQIATRWCVPWHVVKSALERVARNKGEEIDLKINMQENRKRRTCLYE